MTISRKLTSITTAIAIAVASFGPLATSASAGGYDGYRGGDGYGGRHYSRHDGRGYRGDGYRGGRNRYYARHYRKRDNTGKYIALGVGALMLGIIAS
ncbi:MAG: hypothetical protein Q8K85_10970, partial [Hyphomicrobium sp.]|nr:hypothetical protein [Hyphomicrobium sp.]